MSDIKKYVGLVAFFSTFGITQSLQSDLLDCAQSNDSLQRLVCYDNLAKKTQVKTTQEQNKQTKKQKIVVTPSPPVLQKKAVLSTKLIAELPIEPDISKPKPIVNSTANFGQENIKHPKGLISQIQATVIKTKKAPRGELIIFLDNGQVWRQTDSTRLKLSKDNVVIIERGALGSFFIGKENANKRIRAKRVK
ncbi:hypothetical protein [Paraglaciecola sp. MB-3u-78]|jgi:hypothetical protein|uniref:hypothetical protein n=1 Tax=Paraglaciecola sp. MB-3u-78 TaxID=2058332 RepID=UPI000C345088|nr:hypothetical protein [Paraglaciecola sp. MB-3u-78]PKG98037.1 hypothetical protein CXF95_16700 [Paraglaciecola sp. MB-3u-78]